MSNYNNELYSRGVLLLLCKSFIDCKLALCLTLCGAGGIQLLVRRLLRLKCSPQSFTKACKGKPPENFARVGEKKVRRSVLIKNNSNFSFYWSICSLGFLGQCLLAFHRTWYNHSRISDPYIQSLSSSTTPPKCPCVLFGILFAVVVYGRNLLEWTLFYFSFNFYF